jgi:hypothetical protein
MEYAAFSSFIERDTACSRSTTRANHSTHSFHKLGQLGWRERAHNPQDDRFMGSDEPVRKSHTWSINPV